MINASTNLIVSYHGSIQTCFISLPPPLFQKASSTKGSFPLKLTWDCGTAFVGASTLRPSSTQESLEISPIFARCLGIPENVYINVECKPRYHAIPTCSQILVEPVSLDDWEIIASSAGYIESEFLNQVDILEVGNKFPFWIKNQALVYIRVVSAANNGCDFVKLGRNSQIVVKPSAKSFSESSPRTIADSVRLRVNHCIDRIGSNRVAVRQSVFESLELPPLAFARLHGKQEITVQLVATNNCSSGHILLPPMLRSRLGVQRFEHIIVHRLCEYPSEIDASNMGSIPALLVRRAGQIDAADGEIIDIVVDQDVVLIGPDVAVEDNIGNIWSIRSEDTVIVLGQGHTLLHVKFLGESKMSDSFVDDADHSIRCSVFPNLLDSISSRLALCLGKLSDQHFENRFSKLPHSRFFSGICLTGNPGVGKSFFLHALAKRLLVDQNVLAAEFWISCAAMASDKTDDIKAHLKSVINTAISQSPSIIIFDDLDSLLPCPAENDSGLGLRVTQISEYLADLLIAVKNVYRHLPITWVASSSTYSSIHPSLRFPGAFSMEVALPVPDYDIRKDIIMDCLEVKGIDFSDLDLDFFAYKSDGFVAQDIVKIIEHSVHTALSQEKSAVIHLKTSHIESVLNDFTPRSRQGIDLKTSDVSWSDIGGLEEVRKTLRETFELPARYPFLFQQSPLKLRSGLLLFGPPGCGKTLVASAVARECGLNFISIKGPELLNKYIGESEQGIRAQFSRAGAAAPCILFFDEFESIAPRRGADSTGVTDRVVNQMLCHLDGVELRTGVYVLAATSRPDLLDPALLRPGRFDKCLYCGIPDFDARLSILRMLSRKMNLKSDIDLSDIAQRTSNYTGADLQGVLNSAHIAAVHEAIEQRSNHAIITGFHIDQALQNSRLSVSAAERQRFTSIYAAFMGSQPSDFSLQLREGKIGSRTAVK